MSEPTSPTPPSAATLDYGSTGSRRVLLRPWMILLLILLAAAALRWHRIGHYSLWLDEFLSLENSTGRGQLFTKLPRKVLLDPAPALTRLSDGPGFWRIWTSLDTETHPPLYFMLLNPWRHVFGQGDVAARSFSAAMSVLSIILLYQLAKLLHGPAPALWACAIFAAAGPQIAYSHEARPYTFALALMLAAALALVAIEKRGPSLLRALLLAGSILAMLLTHYLSFGPVLALALYALIRLRGRAMKVALGAFAAAALVYAIAWGPFLYEQATGFTRELGFTRESETTANLPRTLERIASLPLRFFTEPMSGSRAVGYLASVIFIIPLLLLPKRRDLLLWCLLLITPILQVAASDVIRGGYSLLLIRYTFLATAPAYALVAAMLADKAGLIRHVVPLVISVSCVAAITRAYDRWQADWRLPAAALRENVKEGDVVVFFKSADQDWGNAAFYLAVSHYAPPPVPVVLLGEPPSGELAEKLASYQRIWFMSGAKQSPVERVFPGLTRREVAAFPYEGSLSLVQQRQME